MIRNLLVTALIFVAPAALLAQEPVEDSSLCAGSETRRNPLLLGYHDIVDTPSANSDITPQALRGHLRYLKSLGYTSLSADQIERHLTQGLKLPEKSMLLTFDDGYLGTYTAGVPIVESEGLKASFFVHTNYVGVRTSRDHMTWEHLKQVDANPLFEVFSHTLSHPNLTTLTDEALKAELEQSRAALERNLGGLRPYFAYPYGIHDARVIQATKQVYSMAIGFGEPGRITEPLYEVPRLPVDLNLIGMNRFRVAVKNWVCGSREPEYAVQ